jgi:hypothetical protein
MNKNYEANYVGITKKGAAVISKILYAVPMKSLKKLSRAEKIVLNNARRQLWNHAE